MFKFKGDYSNILSIRKFRSFTYGGADKKVCKAEYRTFSLFFCFFCFLMDCVTCLTGLVASHISI